MSAWSVFHRTTHVHNTTKLFSKYFLSIVHARGNICSLKYDVKYGGHCRAPHSDKTCEDDYFIWDDEKMTAFGVADGVSEWRKINVDPSIFPKTLLSNCKKYFKEGKMNPKDVLNTAYNEILEKDNVVVGSSTVCLGVFDKIKGHLETLNLGDSGFSIFRNSKTFYKSSEQYQQANTPFQIGVESDDFGNAIPSIKSVSDANMECFDIEDDDIIVFGTDGLFDNMYTQDIFSEIYSPDHNTDYEEQSRHLTKVALARSVESQRVTPREERIMKDDPLAIPGGNFDDVTAVIVHVKAYKSR